MAASRPWAAKVRDDQRYARAGRIRACPHTAGVEFTRAAPGIRGIRCRGCTASRGTSVRQPDGTWICTITEWEGDTVLETFRHGADGKRLPAEGVPMPEETTSADTDTATDPKPRRARMRRVLRALQALEEEDQVAVIRAAALFLDVTVSA